MIPALIFDVDGTLADTERDAHLVAFNEAFAEFCLEWHWSETLYGELLAVTGGKERIKFFLDQYLPDFPRPDDLDGFIADLHKAKTKYYNSLIASGKIPLRPGVKRLIQEAHEMGLRLAIATTTTLENVTTLLEASLDPQSVAWFEVIGAGNVVPKKKPAPDIYHYVLEKMQLTAKDCIAFEDSENGLKATSAAGLPTIITINDYTCEQDFTGALAVLDHLGEPDRPFSVIQGNIGSAQYVDVTLLQRLSIALQSV